LREVVDDWQMVSNSATLCAPCPGRLNSKIAEACRLAVEYSLAHYLYDQAVFYAERLVAELPSDDSLLLLASSYFRAGDSNRAYVLLQDRRSPEPRLSYLLGLCCLRLGKLDEVERALVGEPATGREVSSGDVAGGAAGLYLLGQVKEKLQYRDQAVECYRTCLKLCPCMWSAFESLSRLILGTPCAPSSARTFASEHFSDERLANDPVLHPPMVNMEFGGGVGVSTQERQPDTAFDATQVAAARKRRRSDTLGSGGQSLPAKLATDGDSVLLAPAPVTPPRISQVGRTPLADRSSLPAPTQLPSAQSAEPPVTQPPTLAPARASLLGHTPAQLLSRLSPRRLLSTPLRNPVCRSPAGLKRSTTNVIADASRVGQETPVPVGRNARWSPGDDAATIPESEATKPTFGKLLRVLGEGVHSLHGFACREALSALQSLPARHYETGFVQDVVGRCHFEMADYRQAVVFFARCCGPHRPVGLEYYSTALWHLRESVELSSLAQRAIRSDRLRPQTWCVAGNCFSLQTEHDQAIRCFRRAVQLDSSFVYAYTLIAHEYAATDKFDKAAEMFQTALRIDPRHYNAWWGLGNIYYRQEEYQNAMYHFQKAVNINSGNAVLRTSLGMACQCLGQKARALELFSVAAQSQQCGALACFQKGCALTALGRNSEAIEELRLAQSLAPREPCIHFQLGRAHAGSGNARRALLHLTMAMDLCGAKDSKDHQIIVSAQVELLRAANIKHETEQVLAAPGSQDPLTTLQVPIASE